MLADRILPLLNKVKGRHPSWMACCPAHDDRNPSLSISDKGERIVVHCFAGCDGKAIVDALGLTLDDLKLNPDESWKDRKREADREAMRFMDEFVLTSCAERRAKGEPIPRADLEREAVAWKRQRGG